ncbi:MAG: hypothetical protein AB7T07_05070 [Steroidobacteraceae bacterium]
MSLSELRRVNNAFRWSAACCALVAAVLWLGPYLLRADVFADDMTQHVFWMYRFVDPALFPNDLSVAYFGDSSAAPWGYQALYRVLAQFMDLQVASEGVAVLLLMLSAWLAWCLGAASGDRYPELRALCAVVVVLMLLPLRLTDVMSPAGLQRSFALALMLLCLWALVARRYAWVGVSWLLAALFYPVVLVVQGLASVVIFTRDLLRERCLPPAAISNGVLGVVALLIAVVNSRTPPGIGPTVTGNEARAMAEFYPGGRLPMFGMSFYGDWFNDHHLALGWSFYSLLLLSIALLIVWWKRRLGSIPAAGWVMAIVGLGVWFISRQMLFTLYLPNRHARWSLACFAVLAFSAAASAVIAPLFDRMASRSARASSGLQWSIALLAPILVASALLPGALRDYRQPRDQDMERAYQFIAGLPKDTLVAAHPDLADYVPLRSRRSVLVSTEISLPFMLGYYRQLKPRIEASLRAAYATDFQEMDAALSPFGVKVMLTNASVWDKQGYFKPFDRLVHDLRERGDRLGYALRAPPSERVLFQSGNVYVVKVGADAGPSS